MTHKTKYALRNAFSEFKLDWNMLRWHTGKGSTIVGGGYPMYPPLAISALIFLVPSPTQTISTHALDALAQLGFRFQDAAASLARSP